MVFRAFRTRGKSAVHFDDGKEESKRSMTTAKACCLLALATLVALLTACGAHTPTPSLSSPTRVPLSTTVTPHTPMPSLRSPAQVPPSPTAARRTPAPSPTAAPQVGDLRGPMIVDSQSGRLYVTGRVGGAEQIVALAAGDGRLLASYGLTGTFDVDPTRGWLYVDQNTSGLLVLDAETGDQRALVSLPASQQQRMTYPAPQADPTTGQVLAFRDHLVYVIDVDRGVVATIPFVIPKVPDCRSQTEPLPIERAAYDDARRLLYLDFVTYLCTPWIGETLVSFDMNTNLQIVQHGVPSGPVTAFNGSLYGSGWYRMGVGYRYAWRDGQPWFVSDGWNNSANLLVDAARGRLYEDGASYGFRAFDLETMSLLFVMPSPVDGDLVGYDPGTDQLYYLPEGELATWPGDAVLPPSPQTPQIADPPAKPLRHLIVSSAGEQTHTLFGLWDYGMTSDNCYVWGAQGGLFYFSTDGGKAWVQPRGGLGGGCERISAVAVSPDYDTDRTMFAALVGNGIFRSSDGGQLWRPSSTGLRSVSLEEILLSPGFQSDQMAFSWSRLEGQGSLYRSTDGGVTWERLGVDLSSVAMSPEFDQDSILMGISAGQVVLSRDRGETWNPVGSVPSADSFTQLSLAPLFDRWQVIFAFGSASQHNLYRSADGGRSWGVVLSLEEHAFGPFLPQLAYGPETEGGRLLFLLATYTDLNADPPIDQGTLYRSNDGGLSWEVLDLPADVVPTALAISPAFAQDGLIWLGTVDGRAIPLEAAQLRAGA